MRHYWTLIFTLFKSYLTPPIYQRCLSTPPILAPERWWPWLINQLLEWGWTGATGGWPQSTLLAPRGPQRGTFLSKNSFISRSVRPSVIQEFLRISPQMAENGRIKFWWSGADQTWGHLNYWHKMGRIPLELDVLLKWRENIWDAFLPWAAKLRPEAEVAVFSGNWLACPQWASFPGRVPHPVHPHSYHLQVG